MAALERLGGPVDPFTRDERPAAQTAQQVQPGCGHQHGGGEEQESATAPSARAAARRGDGLSGSVMLSRASLAATVTFLGPWKRSVWRMMIGLVIPLQDRMAPNAIPMLSPPMRVLMRSGR
jgi:hypothetical protein